MTSQNNDTKHNLGHRERLKKRFLSAPSSLADYELLELLMFYVFTRKDTKALAKTLLNHFKTLGSVVGAA
ncbi:MAG: hypothetical protein LBB29_00950 [Holosporaceae bacterium]|jgi:DNA repair protein RadC|nr:hypothetical protein [Holosporaceae bacterium]